MEGAAPRYVGIAVSRETSAQAAVEEALRAVDLDDTCFLLALVPDGGLLVSCFVCQRLYS